jgi:hypothetical protein
MRFVDGQRQRGGEERREQGALLSAPMIHFHNGDVAASAARRAGVPGRHVPFRESLAGGPVRPNLPLHEWGQGARAFSFRTSFGGHTPRSAARLKSTSPRSHPRPRLRRRFVHRVNYRAERSSRIRRNDRVLECPHLGRYLDVVGLETATGISPMPLVKTPALQLTAGLARV